MQFLRFWAHVIGLDLRKISFQHIGKRLDKHLSRFVVMHSANHATYESGVVILPAWPNDHTSWVCQLIDSIFVSSTTLRHSSYLGRGGSEYHQEDWLKI